MALLQRLRGWFGGEIEAAAIPKFTFSSESLSCAGLEIKAAVVTDVGRARTENQDAVVFTRPGADSVLATHGVIAVIADGMGGCNGGMIASTLACDSVPRHYFSSTERTPVALRAAVEATNNQIYQTAQEHPELAGMGTTCIAVVVVGNRGWLAYVGDSRLYLIRAGHIYRMSEDHSVVFEMVRQGLLTPEEARNHEDRNVLSRALGTKPYVEVSCWEEPFPIRSDDRFLLCSDGLHDLVADDELLKIAGNGEGGAAAEKLVETANKCGGHDNISVILLDAMDRAAPTRRPPAATREVQLP